MKYSNLNALCAKSFRNIIELDFINTNYLKQSKKKEQFHCVNAFPIHTQAQPKCHFKYLKTINNDLATTLDNTIFIYALENDLPLIHTILADTQQTNSVFVLQCLKQVNCHQSV